ncbi:MAG: DUF6132 family protein [Cyclobacteriaceae bacterium]
MKYLKWLIAITIGASVGFSYWYFIGCTSGSCAITSSPINSSLYGGVMGILILNSFSTAKKSRTSH